MKVELYWSNLEFYIHFYHQHDPNGEPSAYVWIEPLSERLSAPRGGGPIQANWSLQL